MWGGGASLNAFPHAPFGARYHYVTVAPAIPVHAMWARRHVAPAPARERAVHGMEKNRAKKKTPDHDGGFGSGGGRGISHQPVDGGQLDAAGVVRLQLSTAHP